MSTVSFKILAGIYNRFIITKILKFLFFGRKVFFGIKEYKFLSFEKLYLTQFTLLY